MGGELNACENCVDRHVQAGHGDQVAIIHDSPVTDSISKLTYQQLFHKVTREASHSEVAQKFRSQLSLQKQMNSK